MYIGKWISGHEQLKQDPKLHLLETLHLHIGPKQTRLFYCLLMFAWRKRNNRWIVCSQLRFDVGTGIGDLFVWADNIAWAYIDNLCVIIWLRCWFSRCRTGKCGSARMIAWWLSGGWIGGGCRLKGCLVMSFKLSQKPTINIIEVFYVLFWGKKYYLVQ